MRVMEEQMKKGNKRYTKRMSLLLSVRIAPSVFSCSALHIQAHNYICPHISETELCFNEIISLRQRGNRVFSSGLLKKT